MARTLAAIFAAGLLAACTPKGDDGSPALEPADAPTAAATAPPGGFAGAIDARGTEPFWALEIRSGGIKLQRPDHPDLTAPNPGPQAQGDAATWGAAGDPLQVTLGKTACSDGMSDRLYPMAATVQACRETLRGCAAPAESAP